MDENTLYSYWEQNAFELGPFRTNQGEQVEVISPGRRNSRSGPDYIGCILDVDGEIYTGEVEIHVHERDWVQHGHHNDESFDNVTLHFCLTPDTERVSPGQIQRTIALEDHSGSNEQQVIDSVKQNAVQTRCPAGYKLKQTPGGVRNVLQQLEQLGRKRIQRRVAVLKKQLRRQRSRLAVLGNVLCECVCMRRNRSPAQTLARHIQFHHLKRRFQKINDRKRAQVYGEGVLLQKAGLLSMNTDLLTEPEWVKYRSKLKSMIPDVPSNIEEIAWNHADVRPVNTPYRRLAGFIGLFRRFFVDFSVDQFESVLMDQVRETEVENGLKKMSQGSDLLSYLTIRPEQVASYWNQHSQPGKAFHRPQALIGSHRAAVIWINGLLPYLIAVAQTDSIPEVSEKLWNICQHETLPLGDRRSETVSYQIFGEDAASVPKTGFTDQGLHELHKSFCRFGPNGCSRCPINRGFNDSGTSAERTDYSVESDSSAG